MANRQNDNIIIGDLEGQIQIDHSLPLPVIAFIRNRHNHEEILRGFFSDPDSARAWLEVELPARSKNLRPLF